LVKVGAPWHGIDIWNAYEVSFLLPSGKPWAGIARIQVDAQTPCLVESKSLKLYLNGLNNTTWPSVQVVQDLIEKDLALALQASPGAVQVELRALRDVASGMQLGYPSFLAQATCLDDLEVHCADYTPEAALLACVPGSEGQQISQVFYSELLRTRCPCTGQPDWATVILQYTGRPICAAALLRYWVSWREHVGFGEHCAEALFLAIQQRCAPQALSLYVAYTRRGGIDINVYRSTVASLPDWLKDVQRFPRQ
jgi:7-cyano-7-deazaguanine reductase